MPNSHLLKARIDDDHSRAVTWYDAGWAADGSLLLFLKVQQKPNTSTEITQTRCSLQSFNQKDYTQLGKSSRCTTVFLDRNSFSSLLILAIKRNLGKQQLSTCRRSSLGRRLGDPFRKSFGSQFSTCRADAFYFSSCCCDFHQRLDTPWKLAINLFRIKSPSAIRLSCVSNFAKVIVV